MSRTRRPAPSSLVVVTRDPARGRALVTGSPAAERVAVLVARDAQWSARARGWVIADGDVVDIRAYCQAKRLLLVERIVGGARGSA